eukprot:360355-Amphidinium_carterae.2
MIKDWIVHVLTRTHDIVNGDLQHTRPKGQLQLTDATHDDAFDMHGDRPMMNAVGLSQNSSTCIFDVTCKVLHGHGHRGST